MNDTFNSNCCFDSLQKRCVIILIMCWFLIRLIYSWVIKLHSLDCFNYIGSLGFLFLYHLCNHIMSNSVDLLCLLFVAITLTNLYHFLPLMSSFMILLCFWFLHSIVHYIWLKWYYQQQLEDVNQYPKCDAYSCA